MQVPDQTADGPVHPRLRARAAADVLRLRLSQDYAHSKTLVLRFGRGILQKKMFLGHCWKCDNLLHPVRQLLFLRLRQQEEVCCEEGRLDAKLRNISILSSMYLHILFMCFTIDILSSLNSIVDVHGKCKMYVIVCSDSVYICTKIFTTTKINVGKDKW